MFGVSTLLVNVSAYLRKRIYSLTAFFVVEICTQEYVIGLVESKSAILIDFLLD